MKLSTIKKYKKNNKKKFSFGFLRKNPIILLGVSLPFVIATATGLRNTVAMSLEFLVINFFTAIISVLIANKLNFWLRAVVNVGFATLIMMLARVLITRIFPDISNYLGAYIYLMALNGMVLLQSDIHASKTVKLWPVMKEVVINAFVFSLLMLFVSVPREYFGNGTLWGKTVPAPIKLTGMQLPFYGFVSAAFLLALVRFVTKKTDAFGAIDFAHREANEKARYTSIRVDVDNANLK